MPRECPKCHGTGYVIIKDGEEDRQGLRGVFLDGDYVHVRFYREICLKCSGRGMIYRGLEF